VRLELNWKRKTQTQNWKEKGKGKIRRRRRTLLVSERIIRQRTRDRGRSFEKSSGCSRHADLVERETGRKASGQAEMIFWKWQICARGIRE
jgi:hypothetical protein